LTEHILSRNLSLIPKNALFLLKNSKNRRALGLRPQTSLLPAAGGSAPRPPASGSWGLCPRAPH